MKLCVFHACVKTLKNRAALSKKPFSLQKQPACWNPGEQLMCLCSSTTKPLHPVKVDLFKAENHRETQ